MSRAVSGSVRDATFGDVLRSEWTKLRTLRSIGYTGLATMVVGIGIGALFYFAAARGYADLSPADRAAFDPTSKGAAGFILAQLAIGTFGILAMTSEYASGMIRTSLAVVPRRNRLLAAKSLLLLGVVLVLGEVVGFASFLAGQLILATQHAPHASLADPGVLRAVVGTGLDLAVVGLLGLALGALIRAAAGALAVVVAVTFIVPAFTTVLPTPIADLVGTYWPTMAGRQLATVHPNPHLLGPWTGFAVMCAWVAVTLAAAFVVFHRREV